MPFADYAPFVTGGFALLGTLAGVAVSQHFVTREARLNRAEQHRRMLREELSTLTYECEALIEASWLLIPGLAKMSEGDLVEFVSTDVAKESARRRAQIQSSLVRLRFVAGNPDVVQALAELGRCIEDFAEKANGPAVEAGSSGGDYMAAIAQGYAHVRLTRAALERVTSTSAPLLRVQIPSP